MSKNFSIPGVYHILKDYIEDTANPYNNRLNIYRFLNKLSDSREFESCVNREFSACRLKEEKDKIEERLENRLEIHLPCDFDLRPYLKTRWSLYQFDQPFLIGLDLRDARRIAYDINVAFLIKETGGRLSNIDT